MNDPHPVDDTDLPVPAPADGDVKPVLPVPLAAPAPSFVDETASVAPLPAPADDTDDGVAVAVMAEPDAPGLLVGGSLDLPPPDNKSLAKEKAAAVIAAVVVHVVLALLLGVLVVVVPSPPASEITAISAPATTEQLPTSNKIAEPPPRQSASQQMSSSVKFVTAAGMSSVPMPAVEFDASATALDLGATMGNFNSNFGGAGTGSITMFGKQINTRTISVVMDVSGSMTPYLPIVAKELDKVAPGSNLVLFSGCGLLQEPENVDRELYNFSEAGDRFKGLPPEVHKQISERKKTYFVKGRSINHAQTALLSRRAMMADTVYWFADFQDAVDMGVMKQLIETFKAKNKKIYIHAVRRGRSFDIVVDNLIKPLGGEVIESKVN